MFRVFLIRHLRKLFRGDCKNALYGRKCAIITDLIYSRKHFMMQKYVYKVENLTE